MLEAAEAFKGLKQGTGKMEEEPEPSFACPYCEVDEHFLGVCPEKKMCLFCGLNNHREEKCTWGDRVCAVCKKAGHARRLQQERNKTLQGLIIARHGIQYFMDFLPGKSEGPEQEAAGQGQPGRRGGFRGRGGYGGGQDQHGGMKRSASGTGRRSY